MTDCLGPNRDDCDSPESVLGTEQKNSSLQNSKLLKYQHVVTFKNYIPYFIKFLQFKFDMPEILYKATFRLCVYSIYEIELGKIVSLCSLQSRPQAIDFKMLLLTKIYFIKILFGVSY